MTLDEFKNEYYVHICDPINRGENRVVRTQLIRRIDDSVVYELEDFLNIKENEKWIKDSQAGFTVPEVNWKELENQYYSYHIDEFLRRNDIYDVFPMEPGRNPRAMFKK